MRFELVRDVSVVKSGTKGLIDRLRLNGSEIRVGRTSANQMRLQPEGKESMGLSRYHARFVKSNKDGWMLIDNKSTNGTYVNSIKIPQMKPVELAPNDVIVFGGGGSQAVGGRKRQRTSPFRFFYRKCQDSNNDRTNRSTLSKSTSKSETKSRSSPPIESRQTIPDSSQENMPTETKPSTAVVNQITDTLTCSLCMELLVHAVNLPCGHSCCWMCWDEWSEKKKNCPLCRKEVENETNVVRNFCCDQMVDLIVNQDGYEKEELDVFKERKAESEKFINAKKKRARSSVSNRNSTTTTTSARSEKKRRRQRDTSVH